MRFYDSRECLRELKNQGEFCEFRFGRPDSNLGSDGRIVGLYLVEDVGELRGLQRGDDREKLHVLDGSELQRTAEMILQQFAGHLDNADTGGNRLAREVSLIDETVRKQAEVVAQTAVARLRAKDGVKIILQNHRATG